MKKENLYTAVKSAILFTFVLVLTNSLFAQSGTNKDSVSSASQSAAPKTVNAQQAGAWTVGIDAGKNTVRVANTVANPIPVSVVGGPAQQPFQMTGAMSVFAGGPSSGTEQVLTVPEGKRFVIESVSALADIPAGESIQLMFLTNTNNSPSGNSAYHMIALTPQGTFGGNTILTANHKTLIFGAGRIYFRARPTWVSGSGSASVVFSGYLENLPTAP